MATIKLKIKEISPEKAEFVTEKCEKALQRTLDDREAIQKKGTFILGILTTIIAFGVNLVVKDVNTWQTTIVSDRICRSPLA